MYNVLIVDDEMLARVGVKSLIQWEQHNFTIVGEMENGKEAYNFFLNNQVDIIITDIKMPVMDGIELINKIREHSPYTKFIVLSSFDDFQYVRSALRNGASDYLIKLEIKPEQLLEQLKKITVKIEQERSALNYNGINFEDKNRENSLLQETFFRDILFGWISGDHEYQQRIQDLNLKLSHKNIVCLMFHTESVRILEKYQNEEIHLLNYAILNILREITSEYKTTFAISTQTKEFVILHFSDNHATTEKVINNMIQLANVIHKTIKQYMNLSVSIAISEPVNTYKMINHAFQQVSEIIKYRFVFNGKSIIHYHELNQLDITSDATILKEKILKLEKSLKLQEDINVTKELKGFIQFLEQPHFIPIELLKGYCSTIIYFMSFRKTGNSYGWMDKQLKWINKIEEKSDFLEWITQLYKEWSQDQINLEDSSRLIMLAKQFIQKNYMSDITLETVANHLHISPSYLSNLFKKETEENFIDYLIHTRIDNAKIHLRKREYKIYEVGRMVGYENEYYFSRIFKKVMGHTPREYRSNLS